MMFTSCEVMVEQPVPLIDPRERFTGYFEVEEYSKIIDIYTHYDIEIVKMAHYPESVVIINFYGMGIDVAADIEGQHLYIPYQSIDGFHVEGDGYISGNRLELSYSVHDHYAKHDFEDYCSSVAWRY